MLVHQGSHSSLRFSGLFNAGDNPGKEQWIESRGLRIRELKFSCCEKRYIMQSLPICQGRGGGLMGVKTIKCCSDLNRSH